jgi:hypothetical protein
MVTMAQQSTSRIASSAALLVALLACGMGGGVLHFSVSASAQADDPALIKTLAERALGEGPSGTVQLLPGRVAEELPADVTPVGWKLIGTVTRQFSGPPGAPQFRSAQTYFDAPGLPADAQAVLVNAFTAKGWKKGSFPQFPQGGFVPSPTTVSTLICSANGTVIATIMAAERPVGASQVSMSSNTIPAGTGTPCSPGGSSGPVATVVPQIPAVFANAPQLGFPSGTKVISSGGSGGSASAFTSTAVIESAQSIGDLERHFAGLLATAGWARTTGFGDGQAATSVWRKTASETPLQLILTVAATTGGESRRDLIMVVTMPMLAFREGRQPFRSPFPFR